LKGVLAISKHPGTNHGVKLSINNHDNPQENAVLSHNPILPKIPNQD
jgi:hypothetical protein